MPSIPTDLSATQATHPNKDSSPTLSSFIRTHAQLCFPEIFQSPLLLSHQIQLDSEFQTNSRLENTLWPTTSYPALNGLGIRYPIAPGFSKNEDMTEQEIVPPANVTGLSIPPCPDFLAVYSSDRNSFEEDPFTAVYRLLNSISPTIAHYRGSSPTLQYPDCPDWPLSHDSTAAARSTDDELLQMGFTTSRSSLAEYSSSQSGDFQHALSRSHSPVMLGPFPDINMFDLAYMNRVPEASVNPADIMRPLSAIGSIYITKRSASPPSALFGTSPPSTEQLPSVEVLDSIVAMLSNTAKKENESPRATISPTSHRSTDKHGVLDRPKSHTTNEFATRIGASTQKTTPRSPDEQPFIYRLATPTAAAHRSPLAPVPFQSNQQPSFTSVIDCGSSDSPVLNAHHGIDLRELVDRASKYRGRFPGRAIDKKWLMAYAGKLTKRGELLEDYRCYVNGCTQKNKRRDHILVHVGSHVDQRLFVCSVCPMRFLRKNECKRHEASHSGERPFVCGVCPPHEKKTFVRQDLLKRHLKRAHNVGSTEKQNKRPSKKVKIE